jgi:hypothetical protein
MLPISIDFQEGFTGQALRVYLDDRELAMLPKVKTRMQLGLAETVKAQAEPGQHTLRIESADGRLQLRLPLSVEAAVFVGVSLENGVLTARQQASTFRYA